MARGWDSKAVEDQQAMAEAEKETRAKPSLTAEERERRAKRDGLALARARMQNDLESANDERYRARCWNRRLPIWIEKSAHLIRSVAP